MVSFSKDFSKVFVIQEFHYCSKITLVQVWWHLFFKKDLRFILQKPRPKSHYNTYHDVAADVGDGQGKRQNHQVVQYPQSEGSVYQRSLHQLQQCYGRTKEKKKQYYTQYVLKKPVHFLEILIGKMLEDSQISQKSLPWLT